jgi:spore germination protein
MTMSDSSVSAAWRFIMEIYIVKQGDTLQSIADEFGLSVQKLTQDNGLDESDSLIIGQTLIIAYPQQVYTVQQGDTLYDIANKFNVSIIQLLINNPFLSDREYIYPGETIIISYNTNKGKIITHGNTTPIIDKDVLRKTLPFLSYISVLNFTATEEGDIITYYDDTEIIQISKAYGVAPLMLLTTLTLQGEANIVTTFDILLSEDFQNRIIENILNIIKQKGYYGVNISFQYINVSNLYLYENYFSKIATRLNEEGYQVFLTANPNLSLIDNEVSFEKVDYSTLNQLAQNIIFMTYEWAERTITPSPISSYYETDSFLNYILNYISADKVIIGIATIGYDWELPYVPRITMLIACLLSGRLN